MTTAFYHDERCLWHTTGEHALIIPVGGYVHPSLTTLVQPAEQIAQLTCQILFDSMAGGPPRTELLTGELRVGGTTAPPPGHQRAIKRAG